jgi:ribulose-phosphate 3-epimerase
VKAIQIYPSLISSPLLTLGQTLTQLNPYVAGYHIDIMDGHFVPNLTWGPAFVEALASATTLPLHIHCMVDNPMQLIPWLTLRPQDLVIFHVESTNEIEKVCAVAKERGAKVGLAINPNTSVTDIFDALFLVDHVLIMSVNPGFSGQFFIDAVLPKITVLANEIARQNLTCTIGIDGGITHTNISSVVRNGATQIAAASAIFSTPDPVVAVHNLYAAAIADSI